MTHMRRNKRVNERWEINLIISSLRTNDKFKISIGAERDNHRSYNNMWDFVC